MLAVFGNPVMTNANKRPLTATEKRIIGNYVRANPRARRTKKNPAHEYIVRLDGKAVRRVTVTDNATAHQIKQRVIKLYNLPERITVTATGYDMGTPRSNPRPGRCMSNNVVAMLYVHADDGELYCHGFGNAPITLSTAPSGAVTIGGLKNNTGVQLYALEGGALSVQRKDKAPLWKDL